MRALMFQNLMCIVAIVMSACSRSGPSAADKTIDSGAVKTIKSGLNSYYDEKHEWPIPSEVGGDIVYVTNSDFMEKVIPLGVLEDAGPIKLTRKRKGSKGGMISCMGGYFYIMIDRDGDGWFRDGTHDRPVAERITVVTEKNFAQFNLAEP